MIGCESDGQMGPQPAPKSEVKSLPLDSKTARGLAYYYSGQNLGVLGPRGWHCFGTYGSNGASVYVTPEKLTSAEFFHGWKGISGPGIQLSLAEGETSGRFEAAETIAQLFPNEKAFVNAVIAEGIEPASQFHFGPYPQDRITRSGNFVEFESPPGGTGFGYGFHLLPGDRPIKGVAMLVGGDDRALTLAARLPKGDDQLMSAIIHQVERDNAAPIAR